MYLLALNTSNKIWICILILSWENSFIQHFFSSVVSYEFIYQAMRQKSRLPIVYIGETKKNNFLIFYRKINIKVYSYFSVSEQYHTSYTVHKCFTLNFKFLYWEGHKHTAPLIEVEPKKYIFSNILYKFIVRTVIINALDVGKDVAKHLLKQT